MGRSRGVICRPKTIRCWVLGRSSRRYRAMARPVASGKGIMSSRRPLVRRSVIVPASRSMSSRFNRATSSLLRRQIERAATIAIGAQHRQAALAKGGSVVRPLPAPATWAAMPVAGFAG